MTRSFRYSDILLLFALVACQTEDFPAPEPLLPIPSKAQFTWHEMEMNAFVHFTINTFTDKEWGYGDEPAELFNPSAADVGQWIDVFKEVGFNGVILTCKHHDGFCIWPSTHTEHCVKNSPYKNGKGDIVKEVADACIRQDMRFGVYLSPWDRNHAGYGTPEYVTYYRNQLKELFTNYGPIFEMWFDGANGGDGYYGGANETRRINGATYYNWPATLTLVRNLNPDVIFFSDAGPGVRWVGNERGIAGETNWNIITPDTLYAGKESIEGLLNSGSEDGTHWIPAETDVSIRPGWFYHEHEDSKVKTSEELFDIYLTSVGRGSTLLLNIPPDKRGMIHENDVAALRGLRELLDREFKTNLAAGATVTASEVRGKDTCYSPDKMLDGDKETYWALDDEVTTGSFEIKMDGERTVKYILLQEYIRIGQRVKAFHIEAYVNRNWQHIVDGTTIGYKRIFRIDLVKTERVRVTITDARACPVIAEVAVY
ncbi:MAG TPA: alpha-L-fucosidase [Saprospiraceae bacterium]|nr:alpha-L-fucosidase [Saprospiraceae bacterium]